MVHYLHIPYTMISAPSDIGKKEYRKDAERQGKTSLVEA